MNTTIIAAADPVRPRHFQELVDAIPLPFTPWTAGMTDYQHAIIGTADQHAKDIVAGILQRAGQQSGTIEKFYASLAGMPGVWASDPSPAMSVMDDMVEDEEGHPLDDRTLYHLTVALVHHDMLTAINAERKAIADAQDESSPAYIAAADHHAMMTRHGLYNDETVDVEKSDPNGENAGGYDVVQRVGGKVEDRIQFDKAGQHVW